MQYVFVQTINKPRKPGYYEKLKVKDPEAYQRYLKRIREKYKEKKKRYFLLTLILTLTLTSSVFEAPLVRSLFTVRWLMSFNF